MANRISLVMIKLISKEHQISNNCLREVPPPEACGGQALRRRQGFEICGLKFRVFLPPDLPSNCLKALERFFSKQDGRELDRFRLRG